MTALKINAGRLFLALGLGLSMATGVIGCTSDQPPSKPNQPPAYFKPTFDGDDHAQPVYTSPTVTPAATNLPATNTPP